MFFLLSSICACVCVFFSSSKTGVVNLGVLAPPLGGNVFVRSDGTTFHFTTNPEQKDCSRGNSNSRKACVAFPMFGIGPPPTIRSPNLVFGVTAAEESKKIPRQEKEKKKRGAALVSFLSMGTWESSINPLVRPSSKLSSRRFRLGSPQTSVEAPAVVSIKNGSPYSHRDSAEPTFGT